MKSLFQNVLSSRARLAVGAGICVVFVALTAPYLVPLSRVQQEAAIKASSLTGQDVTFTGAERRFSFPLPRYILRNVQVSGSAGGPVMLRAPSIEAELSLVSLILGKIDVAGLSVIEPKITLSTDGQGRSNWRSSSSMLALFDPQVLERQGRPPRTLSVGDIRIIDGTVLYTDAASNTRTQLERVNVLLHWPDMSKRFALRGQFLRDGTPVKFTASLHKPSALFQKSISPFELTLDTAALNIELSGEIFAAQQLQADAQMHLTSPSLKSLASWSMPQVDNLPEVGAVSASARMRLNHREFILEDATLAIGASNAEGTLAFRNDGPRPSLQGTLDFDMIDLRPFLGQELGNLLVAQSTGTSSAAPQRLSAIDMDLRLSAASLRAANTFVENAALSVLTRDNRVELSLGDGRLFGGQVAGRLVAETQNNGGLKTYGTANLTEVRLDDALREMFGLVRLTGQGDLSLNLGGEGLTTSDILSSLKGEARLRIKEGSLTGINMSALMENADKSAVDAFLAARNGASTIDAASAVFLIADGAAATDDAAITGPGYHVMLKGKALLASGQLDMTGSINTPVETETKLSLPFVIKGPLSSPMIAPDSGLIAAPVNIP